MVLVKSKLIQSLQELNIEIESRIETWFTQNCTQSFIVNSCGKYSYCYSTRRSEFKVLKELLMNTAEKSPQTMTSCYKTVFGVEQMFSLWILWSTVNGFWITLHQCTRNKIFSVRCIDNSQKPWVLDFAPYVPSSPECMDSASCSGTYLDYGTSLASNSAWQVSETCCSSGFHCF